MHPPFEQLKGQTPSMIEGFIYNDPSGINNNGEYVKISNIMYVLPMDGYFNVGTQHNLYRLPKEEILF